MTYNTYTKTGPFTNGGAPGISSSFLNAMETMLAAGWFDSAITSDHAGTLSAVGLIASAGIQPNAASTSLNGATSGTATLWQPFTGLFKLIVVFESTFRNGSGSAQTMAIPTPFTTAFRWWTGDTNSLTFKLGATTLNQGIITTLNAGGGSATIQTNVNSYCMGDCASGCDTISFSSGNVSSHNGIFIMAGV